MWAWEGLPEEVIYIRIFSEHPVASLTALNTTYHIRVSVVMSLLSGSLLVPVKVGTVSVVYFQHLAQSLILSRCLRNICRVNDWCFKNEVFGSYAKNSRLYIHHFHCFANPQEVVTVCN